ncbi:RNA-guided pseudouridylation complex pseudouridine synthase subunit Cbf5 [Candidatus Woesearchaeota archaeon]|nr:RNA-guided pseudouridylation complex pseudouridine synthase subunit Cbf5 [Candidatus Woesearchaeota archaeon]
MSEPKENLLPFERIKREVFVRREAETSPKYGLKPEDRTTEDLIQYGVVNIDKPRGPSSHQISAYVQQILGLTKSGHSGTLDPHVTGVLPIAIGKATKVVQALLTAGKEYVCIMHLHKEVDEAKLRAVCNEFVGRIKQLPPIKSAVKREERFRKIYYLVIIEIDEKDVFFRVGCQAGTYIRKLCHDIGVKLGTGAHMAELRRTKAGPFNESTNLITLQDLQDAFWYYQNEKDDSYIRKRVLQIEKAVEHLPKVWVIDTAVNTICHGANLKIPGISKVESDIQVDELVAVMTLKNELIALGQAKMISKDMVKLEKGIAVRVDRVLMERNTYPKIDKI